MKLSALKAVLGLTTAAAVWCFAATAQAGGSEVVADGAAAAGSGGAGARAMGRRALDPNAASFEASASWSQEAAAAAPAPPPAAKKAKACRNGAACPRKSRGCKFAHPEPEGAAAAAPAPPPAAKKAKACRNGAACPRKGKGCKFAHPEPEGADGGAVARVRIPRVTLRPDALLAERLAAELLAETHDCMVCFEPVRRSQGLWSCGSCHQVLHFKCITKWASSSLSEGNWRCPGCQAPHTAIPKTARCFCGRVKASALRWVPGGVPPHTCGDPCRRERRCGHRCTESCHAGPCPPCPVMVERACHCGATTARVRCSAAVAVRSCGQVCGRTLECGTHTCTAPCHEGPCEPCGRDEAQQCYCGHQRRTAPCGDGDMDREPVAVEPAAEPPRTFRCGAICGRLLSCGKHTCDRPCHPGPCAPCPADPEAVETCPCGAKTLAALGVARESCTDPIPVCDAVCGKPLRCSAELGTDHLCQLRCHTGPCSPCPRGVEVPCRCGDAMRTMMCEPLLAGVDAVWACTRQCNQKLSCGRHRCAERCCPGGDHTCMRICDKPLRCGHHRCLELCHRGSCPPCPHTSFDELTCWCGATAIQPPVPCGTAPPSCTQPCGVHPLAPASPPPG